MTGNRIVTGKSWKQYCGAAALQVRNNEEVKSRLLYFKSLVDGI